MGSKGSKPEADEVKMTILEIENSKNPYNKDTQIEAFQLRSSSSIGTALFIFLIIFIIVLLLLMYSR